MTVSRQVGAVNVPPPTAVEAYVVKVWGETRGLPGGTFAQVEAYVVPASGVGWVDCKWRSLTVPTSTSPHRIKISPEHRRLLADWTGGDQSSIVRQVIQVADEWFAYCTELAEREVAAAALAAESPAPTLVGPRGATGPGQAVPVVSPKQQREILDTLRRNVEEMRKARAGGYQLPSMPPALLDGDMSEVLLPALLDGDLTGDWSRTSPHVRQDAVQGVLVPLAEETVFGMPESASERRSEE